MSDEPSGPGARTAELADGREEELAWIDLIRGACRHDTGDYAAAGVLLPLAVERARRLPTGQPLAQALTMLGALPRPPRPSSSCAQRCIARVWASPGRSTPPARWPRRSTTRRSTGS